MKQSTPLIAILSLLALLVPGAVMAKSTKQRVRHKTIASKIVPAETEKNSAPAIDSALFRVRSVSEIINSLGAPDFKPTPINKTFGPWVFLGYRHLHRKGIDSKLPTFLPGLKVMTNDSVSNDAEPEITNVNSPGQPSSSETNDSVIFVAEGNVAQQPEPAPQLSILSPDIVPKWLRDALTSYRIQEDFMYSTMVTDPSSIDYSYWDLPVPPRLLEDDVTFAGYIKRLNLPKVDPEKAVLPKEELQRRHWLHNVGSSLQFSQAYVSKNWYQGGNNHLALLFNFYWNVNLNQVYHPNLLFQSSLSYKLGLNSTPQDEVHSYSISEDVLQYNLNTGLKAFRKWFYSLNLQFKTQMLRNYEQNSMKRKASFLSPGDLNIGLGMAYSFENSKKTLQLTATVSPISYNLKTCITDKIDHAQFNIAPHRKSRSEAGSNGEFNMTWKMTPNISYRTRVFLFSDYDYFLSDWENTFSFDINRFLSTQIYVHLRYDTSTDTNTSWRHFMLREVLSFGLSYSWSTKP